jgi:cell division protein ZapE
MQARNRLVSDYMERVAAGRIEHSPPQVAALDHFQRVLDDLTAAKPARSWFGGWFGAEPEPVRGLYVHGGVGRGKTMLMDLFFAHADVARKRRAHFHEFMADIHTRIGEARKAHAGDPIPLVARDVAEASKLLCFDEFHVTDIADAMILGRLFEALFGHGVVVVATSNAAPDDLYKDGLNRALFLPFVALLKQKLEVVPFPDGRDFRLRKLSGRRLYFTPNDAAADAGMAELWEEFTVGHAGHPGSVRSLGRDIPVPKFAGSVAAFDFADLCEKPLGARDYLAIAKRFDTIFLKNIPVLTPAQRNEARRFINLIDTLYDNRVCLIATAEADPLSLYRAGDGADHFERTASRLIEMGTEAYLADRGARAHALADAREARAAV